MLVILVVSVSSPSLLGTVRGEVEWHILGQDLLLQYSSCFALQSRN